MRPASMLLWMVSPMRSRCCEEKPTSSGEAIGPGVLAETEVAVVVAPGGIPRRTKFDRVTNGTTKHRDSAPKKTTNPCQSCFIDLTLIQREVSADLPGAPQEQQDSTPNGVSSRSEEH